MEENLNLSYNELIDVFDDINRIIRIPSSIDEDSDEWKDIIKRIILWNSEDDSLNLSIEERDPIKIICNSLGGDLDAAMEMIDTVELSSTPVWTFTTRNAESAAAIIFLCGAKRFMTKRSYLMFHNGSVELPRSNISDIAKFIHDYEETQKNVYCFISGVTGMDVEDISKNIGSDWFIRQEEAIKNNFATDMLTSLDPLLSKVEQE